MKPNIAESIERVKKECARSGWHAEIQKSDALALCNELEIQAKEIAELRQALKEAEASRKHPITRLSESLEKIRAFNEERSALRRDTQDA